MRNRLHFFILILVFLIFETSSCTDSKFSGQTANKTSPKPKTTDSEVNVGSIDRKVESSSEDVAIEPNTEAVEIEKKMIKLVIHKQFVDPRCPDGSVIEYAAWPGFKDMQYWCKKMEYDVSFKHEWGGEMGNETPTPGGASDCGISGIDEKGELIWGQNSANGEAFTWVTSVICERTIYYEEGTTPPALREAEEIFSKEVVSKEVALKNKK